MTKEDILQSVRIARDKVYQHELVLSKDKQYLDEVKHILYQLENELSKDESNEPVQD